MNENYDQEELDRLAGELDAIWPEYKATTEGVRDTLLAGEQPQAYEHWPRYCELYEKQKALLKAIDAVVGI